MLFALAAGAYAVACALFLVHLGASGERVARYATIALWVAVALHVGFHVNEVAFGPRRGAYGIHQALSALSLFVAIAFLLARKRLKITVIGAFITPVNLLIFLGAGLRETGPVPPGLRSAMLPFHIAVNLLGYAAFTLAFGVAIAYLLQERQLKQKQFGGLFQRLPPLDTLDHVGLRLITIGFPLLTVGIVTGALWAARVREGVTFASSAREAFAVVAWLVFGGVLLLRVAAGWRGRRAAIGTMLGFFFACVVLVGYLLGTGASP